MKNRTRWFASSLALATLTLGATAGISGAATGASKAPYKVGIVTEETGIYSAYIQEWMQGMRIGMSYATKGTNKVNGHSVKLTVMDDADNPTTAATDFKGMVGACLLYTSDAADEEDSVDLGGR